MHVRVRNARDDVELDGAVRGCQPEAARKEDGVVDQRVNLPNVNEAGRYPAPGKTTHQRRGGILGNERHTTTETTSKTERDKVNKETNEKTNTKTKTQGPTRRATCVLGEKRSGRNQRRQEKVRSGIAAIGQIAFGHGGNAIGTQNAVIDETHLRVCQTKQQNNKLPHTMVMTFNKNQGWAGIRGRKTRGGAAAAAARGAGAWHPPASAGMEWLWPRRTWQPRHSQQTMTATEREATQNPW